MKAITRDAYGNSDVLHIEEIQKPEHADNEILIRVHFTTVNRTDCANLSATQFLLRLFLGLRRPTSRVPGTDFAGEVVGIGTKVNAFSVGDRVFGLNDVGLASQAEFMVIKQDQAIQTIPKNVGYDQAAACAEGAHYAYNFLNKVQLNKGDKILVNGATGAIGSALFQILKSIGIYVTAVGNTKNMELLISQGADKVYNYETEDFTQIDNDQYDFVFDAVGKSSFGKCKNLLKPKGIYISSELGPGSENLYLPFITSLQGGKRVAFPFPKDKKQSISSIRQLLENGKFKPVIDRTYTPEEVRDAYDYVQSGNKTGNVLIDFSRAEESS
ncbi:NAD(P)-dependent alcohol dehydrogenase [Salibacteraceae bacterium]|nr:NAD(P)-dependent alcohol dehydrogenase [Salibacteraceae bacterium]